MSLLVFLGLIIFLLLLVLCIFICLFEHLKGNKTRLENLWFGDFGVHQLLALRFEM